MVLALIFVGGFAPGVFWLWMIYQRDRYIPAPMHLVVRTFLWGIAIALPVVIIEEILALAIPAMSSLVAMAYISFVIAGMTEEFGKYFVVKKSVYSSGYFRQPLDGLIFSAAAALGFASIENVKYMIEHGAWIILFRAPLTTLAHVFWSAFWGYGLGTLKLGRKGPEFTRILLLVSAVAHGLFNFFLFTGFLVLALVLFLFLALGFARLVKTSQRSSPFRDKVASVITTCPTCQTLVSASQNYCTGCGGHLIHLTEKETQCGRCGSPILRSDSFCTRCGSRLDRKHIFSLKEGGISKEPT